MSDQELLDAALENSLEALRELQTLCFRIRIDLEIEASVPGYQNASKLLDWARETKVMLDTELPLALF